MQKIKIKNRLKLGEGKKSRVYICPSLSVNTTEFSDKEVDNEKSFDPIVI